MSRPIRARIDLSALRHNHEIVRRHAGRAKVWSVIKANAYGHGVVRAAKALAATTDGFAIVELEGARLLREAGIRQPILMLEGPYGVDELSQYAELSLTPVLHSMWQVDALLAAQLAKPLSVVVKINTGMNRLGFNAADFDVVLGRLQGSPSITDITVLTHFADADEPRGIAEQLAQFKALVADKNLPVSLANSAAILRFMPELDFAQAQWVRPGIMLYGASPFPAMQSAEEIGLKPVMTLESELIAVRELQPGDAVGYGSSFVAERSMRVGVVACGYADGYPRHASTGTPVLVAGRRMRTLGRVSMDKLCVDLDGLPADIGIGAPVVLWGAGMPADDVATAAGTVAYELFCALAPRVPVVEMG